MTDTTHDTDATAPDTKAARTRVRIMDATARVLGRRGFARTPLSEIAKEAGLQAAAIYYHFTSREELIETVIREGTVQVNNHVRHELAGLPARTDPLDKIAVAVSAHLQVALGLSDYIIAAVRNSRQLPDYMRDSIRVNEEEYAALWRDLIDEAHQAGRIRSDADPYLSRMLVFGALNWAVEWWRPENLTAETVIETAQTIVRRGLENRAAPIKSPLFIEPK
ncbi:TetR/AcrR family transcriptional regulator [Rhodococcus sp. IEGM 1366]|uniref:TetR/AcrR family transcriptional regulator n=1 Tax=Rhodococcus sp. IEGM 1366 TaxID=3082223 RepID=UPI0029532F42|nr:TetR/AcrR family transcriptional regulator [Rhodococcus sp. IEGM 1366]MDV8070906.1 TetR/AcrR family transcriptional regulator [Rhodococcus sp. IEGM 1366]